MTHLLTFSGYGTHLHGDPRGSWKNGNPHEPHAAYEQAMRDLMPQPPFFLTAETRPIVLGALVDLAGHRDWHLLAAHVRTSHVHLVLVSNVPADRALVACKAAATKALNHADSDTLRKALVPWRQHPRFANARRRHRRRSLRRGQPRCPNERLFGAWPSSRLLRARLRVGRWVELLAEVRPPGRCMS